MMAMSRLCPIAKPSEDILARGIVEMIGPSRIYRIRPATTLLVVLMDSK